MCPIGFFNWVIYIPMVFYSMSRTTLTQDELQESDEESDESYKPSDISDEDSESGEEEGDGTAGNSDEQVDTPAMIGNVIWSLPTKNTYVPRFSIPNDIQCVVDPSITPNSSPLEIFNKLFPRSLFIFIADCTNQRIQVCNRGKSKSAALTDAGEIMITLGCSLVMCYNKLPKLRHYWSSHASLGNVAIKSAISKNRCLFLLSKLYFNNPFRSIDLTVRGKVLTRAWWGSREDHP